MNKIKELRVIIDRYERLVLKPVVYFIALNKIKELVEVKAVTN